MSEVHSRRDRRWATLVTSLGAMLMTLDITVVNVALPQIRSDLHAALDSLQWVVNAYTLVFAALLLTAGALSDRLGRRRIFLLGVSVFTVASAACALAPNVGVLIAARAVQGIGGAMVMGTSLALIAGVFEGAPAAARTRAIMMFTAGGAAAAALGPLVGGIIVESLSWQFLFAINVPIGLLIAFGAVLRVPETVGDASAAIDLVGAVLAVAMLFAVNYGLITGAEQGWSSLTVEGSLIASAVLAAAFVAVQWRRGERAMLDLRLFAIPSFTGAIVLSYSARIFSFGLYPFVILWLSGILHFTPLQIGLVLLVQSVALVLGAPLGGLLAKFIPVSGLLALGMGLAGLGMILSAGIGPHDDWTAILPMLILVGIGAGLILPHLLGIAVGVVPAARAGTASGAVNSFFPLGTTTGVAAFGVVLTAQVGTTLSQAALDRAQVPADAGILRGLVSSGQFDAAGAVVPGPARDPLLELARVAYTEALSTIFLIAGIAAFVAAIASLLLIRSADRVADVVPRPADTREALTD